MKSQSVVNASIALGLLEQARREVLKIDDVALSTIASQIEAIYIELKDMADQSDSSFAKQKG